MIKIIFSIKIISGVRKNKSVRILKKGYIEEKKCVKVQKKGYIEEKHKSIFFDCGKDILMEK